MMLKPVIGAAAALVLIASAAPASAFSASYSWAGIAACDKVSPDFKLSAVPPETKRLRMFMTDLDAPKFHHGGGVMPYYGGDEIKKGAIDYIGRVHPPASITATPGRSKRLTKTAMSSAAPMKRKHFRPNGAYCSSLSPLPAFGAAIAPAAAAPRLSLRLAMQFFRNCERLAPASF
jgi:hypothetical protein